MATAAIDVAAPVRPGLAWLLLYLLLGFAAGLPFYMFNAVLLLRLARHGVDLVTVGFFAWVALLPTFKFAWAPLLDKYDVPGFGRFWGKRRGWIMLAQLGIFLSTVAMAFTSSDKNLMATALFAVLLAFWTTTLEVAADAWRIELAPTAEQQGPLVAANLWGYRSAMIAAGGGAIYIAAKSDWTTAYLAIAVLAFLPFPILAAMRRDPGHGGGRGAALVTGLTASAAVAIGWTLFSAIGSVGMSNPGVMSYWVFAVALLPFVALGIAVPWLRKLPADAPLLHSSPFAPYVNVAWRYGMVIIPILLFVSVYRMGDVMALTWSHPLFNAMGYKLEAISVADSWIALPSSMIGVALARGQGADGLGARDRRSRVGDQQLGVRLARAPASGRALAFRDRGLRCDSGRFQPLSGDGDRPVRARLRGRGVRGLSLDAGEPALSRRAICAAVGARLPAAAAARGAVGGFPAGDGARRLLHHGGRDELRRDPVPTVHRPRQAAVRCRRDGMI